MRICLVTSPRFDCKPKRKSFAPLGMACLAAVAREAGHEICTVEGILIGNPKRVAAAVAACEPDVVGTSTTTQDRLAGLAAIRAIRSTCPEAFIVVGGSHFTHSAEDALSGVPEIDAVVMGEGEVTFLELLERLPGRDRFDEVLGLAWREADGSIVRNGPRPPIEDLDALPRPAWDLFGIESYDQQSTYIRRSILAGAPSLVTGVMTSRGCPQSCIFCANGVPTKVRYMSAEHAVDQLQWLATTYGVDGLDIFDDNFYASESHVRTFCEELLRRNCTFTWWALARLKNLNSDLLHLMKRAGCRTLSFGVETGTDEVLKAIHKNVTTADMLAAAEIVREVGFERIGIFLLLGLPGETIETIDRSIAFLKTLRATLGHDAWGKQGLIGGLPLIFPGTGLEPLGRIEGCLPSDFHWYEPYRTPRSNLSLVNRRYLAVPHFETRSLPLEAVTRHIRRHHNDLLSPGQRRRYRKAPLRTLKAMLTGA